MRGNRHALSVILATVLLVAASPARAQGPADPPAAAATDSVVPAQTGEPVGPVRTPVLQPVEPVLPPSAHAASQTENRIDSVTLSLSGTAVIILLVVLLVLVID